MEGWIMDVIERFGYAGIFFLVAIENLFPPIPSEVILTFGGFATTRTDLTYEGVVAFSTAGSVAGAVILYALGTRFDEERLGSWVDRWGRYVRLTREDLRKTNEWFEKHGPWAVFFGRFIPLIRSLISIPAGMVRMRWTRFLALTTLGTLIWNAVLVYLGTVVGASWETIVHYFDLYSKLVYIALVLGGLGVVGLWVRKKYSYSVRK